LCDICDPASNELDRLCYNPDQVPSPQVTVVKQPASTSTSRSPPFAFIHTDSPDDRTGGSVTRRGSSTRSPWWAPHGHISASPSSASTPLASSDRDVCRTPSICSSG